MAGNGDRSLTPDIKFQLIKKIERHKIIGLAGPELLEHEAKYLEFHGISGVILFERNIESFSQARELVESIDERLAGDGSPPLVMADHEGDFVSALKRLIGVPPAALAIAATGDASLARDVARETGEAMRKLGVNTVLAPVADLYLDPSSPITGLRTFGMDPERVAEYVARTIEGFEAADVLTCAKHFPGHGATPADSHETLPEVRRSLDGLREREFVPFVRAVDAGVDMMMMAHVAFTVGDESDDGVPASFDPRFIRGVLREEMGFDGVVLTDALEMEGARAHSRARYGGLTGGFERSLLAGADLMLYTSAVPERMTFEEGSEPAIAVEVMQTIIETLHKVVDRDRIERKLAEAARSHEGLRNMLLVLDESERRIDALRAKAAKTSAPVPKPEGNVIHLGDYASTPPIYKSVAERALVLLRDPESFIPVAGKDEWTLLPIECRFGPALGSQDIASMLEALCRAFPAWRAVGRVVGFERDPHGVLQPLFEAPDRKVILDAQRATGHEPTPDLADDARLIPIFSSRARPGDEFVEKLAEFVEQRTVPFVIVTGAPITDWIPETVGVLLTLGSSPQVAAAAAAVLAGQAQASGSLAGIL